MAVSRTRPCRLYAELMILVAREYFVPATGSSENCVRANAAIVSPPTGTIRSMKSSTYAPTHGTPKLLNRRTTKCCCRLAGSRGSLAEDPRPALLGAQD